MRNKQLDILRCIAVLLVIGRHGLIHGTWWSIGWAGVDLFFVLSGFLISGLLFTEYKQTQSISLRRFFIRRGFKVYPAFWVMLAASFLIAIGYKLRIPFTTWLHELLFIQNYDRGVWRHTWSLAVEEHFYIILPLLLFTLNRFSRNRKDPFWFIPYAFCIIAPVTLALRYLATIQPSYTPEEFWKITFLTHYRIDALFCGVALGYLYHFRPEFLPGMLRNRWNRLAFEFLTVAFVSCCFIFREESQFLQTLGLTLVYLGFAGIVTLCLTVGSPDESPSRASAAWSKVGNALAFVGLYSYSIYLWHIPVVAYGLKIVRALSPVELSAASLTYIYAAISIPFGILMARLVEFPALKLRDRLFPRLSSFVIQTRAETTETAETAPSDAILT